MRTLIVGLSALVLTGCASSSGVMPAGGDTFRISSTAITSFGGAGTAASSAFKRAQASCAETGKSAEVVDQKTNAQFTAGSVDLTFRCVAK